MVIFAERSSTPTLAEHTVRIHAWAMIAGTMIYTDGNVQFRKAAAVAIHNAPKENPALTANVIAALSAHWLPQAGHVKAAKWYAHRKQAATVLIPGRKKANPVLQVMAWLIGIKTICAAT